MGNLYLPDKIKDSCLFSSVHAVLGVSSNILHFHKDVAPQFQAEGRQEATPPLTKGEDHGTWK